MYNVIQELGDNLSLADVEYMMKKIAEPSDDLNITEDEFYYLMTRKPEEIELISTITKRMKK